MIWLLSSGPHTSSQALRKGSDYRISSTLGLRIQGGGGTLVRGVAFS